MKIVYVTPEFIDESTLQPFDGGLSSYLNKITTSLAQLGNEIFVIQTNSTETKKIEYKGLHVIFINSKFKKTFFQKLIWPFLSKKNRRKFKSQKGKNEYKFLHRIIQKENKKKAIDIIQYASYLAMGKYPEKNIPSCVRISSYAKLWQKYYNYENPQEIEDEVIQFKNARFMYGPSKYIADYIKKDLALKKDIQVIETPFTAYSGQEDLSLYNILESKIGDKPYLLFFGSLGLLKGAREIADSINHILTKYPDLYLVLVGKEMLIEGKSPVQIIQEKAGKNSNRVIWYDCQPHATLFPLIRHAKAILLPLRVDNLPNTCIEAMGLRKIVIGSRGASFEQLIDDGKSGFLCQAGDSESIKIAVDKLMDLSEMQIKDMEQKAYERSLTLSLDNIVPQVISYYNYVINNWRKK